MMHSKRKQNENRKQKERSKSSDKNTYNNIKKYREI